MKLFFKAQSNKVLSIKYAAYGKNVFFFNTCYLNSDAPKLPLYIFNDILCTSTRVFNMNERIYTDLTKLVLESSFHPHENRIFAMVVRSVWSLTVSVSVIIKKKRKKTLHKNDQDTFQQH